MATENVDLQTDNGDTLATTPRGPSLRIGNNIPTVDMEFVNTEYDIVGTIRWGSGAFVFEGDAEESAKIFFNSFLKPLVDDYILRRTHTGHVGIGSIDVAASAFDILDAGDAKIDGKLVIKTNERIGITNPDEVAKTLDVIDAGDAKI